MKKFSEVETTRAIPLLELIWKTSIVHDICELVAGLHIVMKGDDDESLAEFTGFDLSDELNVEIVTAAGETIERKCRAFEGYQLACQHLTVDLMVDTFKPRAIPMVSAIVKLCLMNGVDIVISEGNILIHKGDSNAPIMMLHNFKPPVGRAFGSYILGNMDDEETTYHYNMNKETESACN